MLNYQAPSPPPSLDRMFHALADGTRRGMLDRLSQGPASVGELAGRHQVTLSAVMQHLKVLEESGLVRSEKQGRVRTCRLEPKALKTVEDWVHERRTMWEGRLDRLGDYLAQLPDDD